MNSIEVGVNVEQELVVVRLNGDIDVAIPAGHAVAVGAMIARAGLQLEAKNAPAAMLEPLALVIADLTRMIELAAA